MERLIAKMGMNFKNGPTPHRGAGPNPAKRRHYAFSAVAFLAALAVGLLFLLPGGLLQAQEASIKTFDYTENGTDPVATFTAEDPEEASPIVWSLVANNDTRLPFTEADEGIAATSEDAADDDHFDIGQDGVLEFENKPNYEMPRGAALGGNNTNEYKVLVQASDGTEMSWFKVTVMVMDEEEEGSVKLQPTGQAATTLLQPQVGVGITAHSLADPDGLESSPAPTYQWYRTSSRTAMGTEIDGEEQAAYTPQATAGNSDIGMYLRVVATYTDRRSSNKTATAVSEYVTIGRISDNTPPEFPADTDARAVLEETPKGTLIGLSVSATDADSADQLTYWLSGTGDDSLFDIDAMTGQLKVNTKLNHEGTDTTGDDIDQCRTANACSVTVAVADSSFGSVETGTDTIMVTITVTNVDEKPTSFMGETTIEHPEGTTALDTDLDRDGVQAATYTAMDPEGGAVTWDLSGDDADLFKLTSDNALEFKEKPDFEMPGDDNEDNVYEVTVVASDGVNPATRDVTVKVTNIEEDGEIEVMPVQPRVGVELTAELTDKDGVVSGPTWQWDKQEVDADQNCATDATATEWEEIKDATSESYTPVSKDNDVCLRVTAEYVDGFYDIDDATPDMMFDKTVAFPLMTKVQGASTNMPPMFEEDAPAMRYVPENSPGSTDVGLPVAAKDSPGDTLGHTLSGTDAGAFEITLAGQIRVKADAELDHEAKPMHTVTVTATDSHNARATIRVTIHVTDVDEAPAPDDSEYIKTFDYTENGTDPVATFTAEDPEEASPIVWSLVANNDTRLPFTEADEGIAATSEDAADDDHFDIGQDGVLEFENKPNYEMPRGAALGGNNTNEYKVLVQASDGTEMSWFKVTVMVMDEEEEGSVKLQPTGQAATTLLQPQVGVGITAHSLADPDGLESSPAPTYQWYRTSSRTAMGTEIDGEEQAAYTPQATAGNSDIGMYLRVVATYTDRRSSNKTATAVSEYVTIGEISDNTPPEFPADSAARAVLEETPKGTLIGLSVSATDADSADQLTYWLSGTGDDSLFDIDAMTGQLKVNTKLNHEGTDTTGDDIDQCRTANACSVTVAVADSSFGSVETGTDTIMVTITVTNVDEKPTSFMGETTIEHPEGTTALDTDLDRDGVQAATYTAMDPEGGAVTWDLSGDDADLFKLTSDNALEFKEKPDFEMPGDDNEDNVYEVTVVASDGVNPATRDVTVKVTNIEEDGEIEVMPVQPRVGVELTAELTDKDGVVSGPTWQWDKQEVDADQNCATDATATEWEEIKDATSESYTPVSKDNDVCLRVTAEYVDGFYDIDDATPDMMFDKTVAFPLMTKVQGASTNMPPMFEEDAPAMRYVPENSPGSTDVGLPVAAKDPGETLSYRLGGADVASFEILQDDPDTAEVNEDGQIRVKADAELDHEAKPMHTVTVTATDPHNARATITVTIHVTDVDEMPMIMVDDGSEINRDPRFPRSTAVRYIDENTRAGMPIGPPVTATDRDRGDTLTYSLAGTDGASFDIDSGTGQLMTKSALDYETRTSYSVTVTASDGNGGSDTVTVTINVTDVVNETPGTTLVDRFGGGDGVIDKNDVADAINDYLDGVAGISKRDVADVINYYLDN